MKGRGFSLAALKQWTAVLVLALFGLGILRSARELEMWHLHVEGGTEPTVIAPYSMYGNASANALSYSWNGLTPRITPRLDTSL